MKYCSYCGRQLNEGEACACPGALEEQEAKKNKFSKLPVNKIKKLAIPAVILLVVVIAVICLVSYVQTEIDLEEYIVVKEVTGLNGQGVISYYLDTNALNAVLVGEDYYSDVNDHNYEEALAEAWGAHELAYQAMECISLKASQDTGLKNGDVVTVTASFENTSNIKFPYHFKDATVEYTVSGLREGKELDAFAEDVFQISFYGFNGSGKADTEVLLQDELFGLLRYELSQSYDLVNGMPITVSVHYDAKKLESLNYFAPAVTEKTFIVEGLHDYIASTEEIPAGDLEIMKQLLLSDMQARVDKNLDEDDVLLQEPTILGAYFMSTGDPAVIYENGWHGIEAQNAVIIMGRYAIQVESIIPIMDGTDDNLVIYVFENCYINEDGRLVYQGLLSNNYSDFYSMDEAMAYCQEMFSDYELISLE